MERADTKYSHFDGITVLLEDAYVKRHDSTLVSIIDLNKSALKQNLEKIIDKDFFELMDPQNLERLNDDVNLWNRPTKDNFKRVGLL